MVYLGNAFSLQMLNLNVDNKIVTIPVEDSYEIAQIVSDTRSGKIQSVIGHSDLANLLGVNANRISVKLNKYDILYVAQVTGGRLPEGCTKLPDGVKIKFVQVIVN